MEVTPLGGVTRRGMLEKEIDGDRKHIFDIRDSRV